MLLTKAKRRMKKKAMSVFNYASTEETSKIEILNFYELLRWQSLSNIKIMLWPGLITVIHTRHDVITARSYLSHHGIEHDHAMVTMVIIIT